jgi:hypothetical protein
MHTAVDEISPLPQAPQAANKAANQLPLILAISLVTRLLVIWFVTRTSPKTWLYSRGIELGTLAQTLLTTHQFSSPFGGSTGPTALLTPGYPAIIACIFSIFGSFTAASAVAVMVMQTLFSVITVWMIVRVTRRVAGSHAANIAGLFWALSLPLLWMPTIFWETCLSTLCIVGMVDLALNCKPQSPVSRWFLMGICSGLACLVNPALLLTLLAIFGWSVWETRTYPLTRPLLGLLAFFLVFAPWPIRNAHTFHAFVPLRSTIGFELWMGNRDNATGFLDVSLFPIFNKPEYDSYVHKGEILYMHDKSALARTYIHTHPYQFVRLSIVRVFRFWTGTGTKDGSVAFPLHAGLTTVLGAFGLWRLIKARRYNLVVLFGLPLVLFPLPYYITHAEFRYRLLLDPILTILSAFAISSFRSHEEKS